jgi:glc operon protein GlcG
VKPPPSSRIQATTGIELQLQETIMTAQFARTLTMCCSVFLAAGAASAQLVEKQDKHVLTLAGAKAVADAAAAEAKKTNAGGSIAVVDDGGNLLYLERLDNTFAAAANISIAKARSAATFRRPTSVFEEAIKNGRLSLVANPELLPLQGGVPIMFDGQIVGAVGVAGANSAQQDEDIAKIAATALQSMMRSSK